MINTGDYVIQFYNRVGARLKDREDKRDSLSSAKKQGTYITTLAASSKSTEASYRPTSFTIDRRIFNSSDNEDTWE